MIRVCSNVYTINVRYLFIYSRSDGRVCAATAFSDADDDAVVAIQTVLLQKWFYKRSRVHKLFFS